MVMLADRSSWLSAQDGAAKDIATNVASGTSRRIEPP
jgi:hypothetical protein